MDLLASLRTSFIRATRSRFNLSSRCLIFFWINFLLGFLMACDTPLPPSTDFFFFVVVGFVTRPVWTDFLDRKGSTLLFLGLSGCRFCSDWLLATEESKSSSLSELLTDVIDSSMAFFLGGTGVDEP